MNRPVEHVNFLDPLRGFSILSVLFLHLIETAYRIDGLKWAGLWPDLQDGFWAILLYPIKYGANIGVPVFFVVSGFCIHLSHVRSRATNFLVFFVRRFFRIYPPYLLAIIFFAFVFPWHRLQIGKPDDVGQLVKHLFLVHNLTDSSVFGINPSFWTIAVEVQLYFLYPIVYIVARKTNWNFALVMTAIVELSIRLFLSQPAYENGTSAALLVGPFNFWFSWSMGAAVADAYVKGEKIPFSNQSPALWFALYLLSTVFKPIVVFSFPLLCLATTSLIAQTLAGRSKFLELNAFPVGVRKGLSFLGQISYSLYLFHQPLLWFAVISPFLLRAPLYSPVHLPEGFVLLFPIVLVAWLLYKYVELPSQALGKRITRKMASRPHIAELTAS